MTRIILLSALITISSCSPKPVVQADNSPIPSKEVDSLNCADLDTLISKSWRLADALQAAYFRLYERNDSLIINDFMGTYQSCFILIPGTAIEKKLGPPTYSDSKNIYYEFLSTDKSRPLCLKFWLESDTVRSIRYQPCWQ